MIRIMEIVLIRYVLKQLKYIIFFMYKVLLNLVRF